MSLKLHPHTARSRPGISDDYVAPVIQILLWLFLAFSILAVAAQIFTKRAFSRPWGVSDLVLVIALLLHVGQSATLLSPAGQVIGTSPDLLSEGTVNEALKVLYIGDILHILSQVAVKGALLTALLAITPIVEHRIAIHTTSLVILAWGMSSILGLAFQCPTPQMWNVVSKRCIDIRAVKTYIAATNAITDLALIAIPSMIIVPIYMPWKRRITILGGFLFRLIVIVASVLQLIFIRRLVFDDQFVITVWRYVVATEVVQTTSILTTCIPFLKPFLMSLESGFLRADDEYRRTAGGSDGSVVKPAVKWTMNYIRTRKRESRELSSIEFQNLRDVHYGQGAH